jgi:hypothetical protein
VLGENLAPGTSPRTLNPCKVGKNPECSPIALTRSADRRTTLTPDGGEGVKSSLTFPSPQRGEEPGVKGNSQPFAGSDFFPASL